MNLPFALYTGGSGGSAPTDPYWAYVKLLISCEGADESTTFTDLSSSPATVTPGGGAKVDTTIDAAGALLLNGSSSGSRLSTTRNAAISTGQFCLEALIRPNAAQTGRIISAQDSGSPQAVVCVRVNADGSLLWIFRDSGGGGTSVVSSSAGLVAMDGSTEYHVALTRGASNAVNLWLDGVSVASGTVATNPDGPGGRPYYIGAFDNTQELFAGYIRWVRVTEGVARYTGAFTPPTPPLPSS